MLYVLPYGGMWMHDSYLSMHVYDGWTVGIGNEWKRHFKESPWQQVGRVQLIGGEAIQSQGHNMIQFVDVQGGWGAWHAWQWNTGASKGIDRSLVTVQVGPNVAADIQAKRLVQNENKPLSFDIGLDAEWMASAAFSFSRKHIAYRVSYEARMNVLGAMWLPDYWQSYYETTESVRIERNVRLSHLGNRQFVHQKLAMDFQFRRSTWQLGVRHEYLHYGDKNQHFARQTVGLVVGCIFDYEVKRTPLMGE